MKEITKKFALLIFALAIVAFVVWFLHWFISGFSDYLTAVPKELGAALIAGIAAVAVSTLTVMVGRYFERKKELDALYRDKKMEIYDEFLKKFFDLFFSNSESNPTTKTDDLVPFLREFIRKLILWSGPEPIAAFLAWKDHLLKVFLTHKLFF